MRRPRTFASPTRSSWPLRASCPVRNGTVECRSTGTAWPRSVGPRRVGASVVRAVVVEGGAYKRGEGELPSGRRVNLVGHEQIGSVGPMHGGVPVDDMEVG